MQALAIDQLLNDDQATAEVVQALTVLARRQKNPEKADALLAREIDALKVNEGRNGRPDFNHAHAAGKPGFTARRLRRMQSVSQNNPWKSRNGLVAKFQCGCPWQAWFNCRLLSAARRL